MNDSAPQQKQKFSRLEERSTRTKSGQTNEMHNLGVLLPLWIQREMARERQNRPHKQRGGPRERRLLPVRGHKRGEFLGRSPCCVLSSAPARPRTCGSDSRHPSLSH